LTKGGNPTFEEEQHLRPKKGAYFSPKISKPSIRNKKDQTVFRAGMFWSSGQSYPETKVVIESTLRSFSVKPELAV
jgi:hypothetical protein